MPAKQQNTFIANVNSINVVLDGGANVNNDDEYNNNWNIQQSYEEDEEDEEESGEIEDNGPIEQENRNNVNVQHRPNEVTVNKKPPPIEPISVEKPPPAQGPAVRERMHSELAKKIGGVANKAQEKKIASTSENLSSSSAKSSSLSFKSYNSHVNITEKSTKEECKEFLASKEFSNK